MSPTTCELLVCSNPKAVNPNTGELVFLARENSTGKLIWVSATEKNHPPPNQIISKVTDDGKIPPELISKLRETSGGSESSPVILLIQSDGILNIPGTTGTTPDILSSLVATSSSTSLATSPSTSSTTSSSRKKNGSKQKKSCTSAEDSPSPMDTSPALGSKMEGGVRASLRVKSENSSRQSERSRDSRRPGISGDSAGSPLSSASSSSSSTSRKKRKSANKDADTTSLVSASSPGENHLLLPPASRTSRSSKRRKFDINHRKLKKPKRPKTGYNYFQLSIRDKLCDKIPMDDRVLHNETVARIIGKKWKALSKQERQVFQTLAEQDKTRYEEELKEYLQKMYELGAEGRYGEGERKKPSRRCFSFDAAMAKPLPGLKKSKPAPSSLLNNGDTSTATSPATSLGGLGLGGFLATKSKLGAQISNALLIDDDEDVMANALESKHTDKWLDDALRVHMGRESRIRSSMSCEHIPMSSHNLFSPVNLFSDKSLNDRKLRNPFGDDLLGGDYHSTAALFENNTSSGRKSPGFSSLPNIDTMFFKEFSAWDADCE